MLVWNFAFSMLALLTVQNWDSQDKTKIQKIIECGCHERAGVAWNRKIFEHSLREKIYVS